MKAFDKISLFILRNRVALIVVFAAITCFMAYYAVKIELSYEYASLLSEKNKSKIEYDKFKEMFGEDGSVYVIGTENPKIFELEHFNKWKKLGEEISEVEGVESLLSISQCVNIKKDTTLRQFSISPLVTKNPETQAEVDSIKNAFLKLKFYQGLVYNPETKATLMVVTIDKKTIHNKERIKIVNNINDKVKKYQKENNVKVRSSGMPYIATITMFNVKNELFYFVIGSILIAAFIMYLFFRSFKIVFGSLLVVGISIIWVLGVSAFFDYKITILSGVIPSLVVIIVIENCIYILNKYQREYLKHGNKFKAITKSIQRIGFASLMTNFATALGFGAFILVPNKMLREFGIVTSINVMFLYVLCIVLLPIILSYLDPPSQKNVKHLENNFFKAIIDRIIEAITHHRKIIYTISLLLLVVGVLGISKMKTSGSFVDDFKDNDPIKLDLNFFEDNFGGVMPFEISIDTKKKNGALSTSTIKKIDELQKVVNQHPEFSNPISLAELFKFSRQAYFGGDSAYFSVPSSMESKFILDYLPKNSSSEYTGLLNSYLDSTGQITRVSYKIADVGTAQMSSILNEIQPKVDSIFDPEKYDVLMTGNSIVYTRGTNFLMKHLFESVVIAIVMISLLMAVLFSSVRMIMVSMIPNIIPLLITAAIMGFTGIPLKPSTLIVFSVGLGISIDNAIQYLSRYRHELKINNGSIKLSAISALHEAGFSMIYTSIVLVLGFSVFIFSGFGGTQALGILISVTLFIAMFFNILVLPSLLLTLDKRLTSKAFTEPIIEIYDGDEDDDIKKEPVKENTK